VRGAGHRRSTVSVSAPHAYTRNVVNLFCNQETMINKLMWVVQ
jgi:hypothetical protein